MREHSELVSLFGRAEVDRAFAHCHELRAWVSVNIAHRLAVIRAMQGLQVAIASHPHEAVKFCQGLEPNVKGLIILDLLESV